MLHLAILTFERGQVEGPFEHDPEFIDVGRFGEEVVSAGSNSLEGIFLFCLASQDDDLGASVSFQQFGQNLQSFLWPAGRGRQTKIQKDNCRMMSAESFQRGRAILREQ